jgi:hypothetical protein
MTMSATISGTSIKMNVRLLREGFARVTDSTTEQIFTPSGGWRLILGDKQYTQLSASEAKDSANSGPPGFEGFFKDTKTLTAVGAPESSKLGDLVTTRVEVKPTEAAGGEGKQYLHLDPKTKLPEGVEFSIQSQTYTMVYTDLKLDVGLTPKDFEWTPPAGWTVAPAQTEPDFTANLLKLGSDAPAFSVDAPGGGKTSLGAAMKGKKATLINFWFYG